MFKRSIILIAALVALLFSGAARAAEFSDESIDTARDAVLARITGAEISNRTFLLTKYGAKGDGRRDCLPAMRKAIRAASKAGGGRIVLPAGTWLMRGPVHLKDNICIEIQEGATMLFDASPELYLPMVETSWEGTLVWNYSPFIYARGCRNVSIIGKGVIDGNAGETFATWRAKQEADKQLSRKQNHAEAPLSERRFGSGHWLRPQLVQFFDCSGVTIADVFITNSPFWCVHLLRSENVICRGLRYDAKLVNNDGIDPEYTRDLLIEGIEFNNGDDNVAIKAGRDNDGWNIARPSENIIIRNCRFKGLHAVVMGSEMSAGVRNVWVEDCTFGGYNKRGVFVKTNPDRGGFVSDIYVRRCEFDEVEDLFYVTSMYAGEGMDNNHFSQIRNLYVDSLKCRKCRKAAIVLQGTVAEPVSNVVFRNIEVMEAETAISQDNTRNVMIENVHIGPHVGVPSQAAPKDNLFK